MSRNITLDEGVVERYCGALTEIAEKGRNNEQAWFAGEGFKSTRPRADRST